RVVFELSGALRTLHGRDDVRFLRHGGPDGGFSEVSWIEVEKLFAELAGSAPSSQSRTRRQAKPRFLPRGLGRHVLKLVPRQVRPAAARFLGLQLEAVLALVALAWEGVQPATWWTRPRPVKPCNNNFDSFARDVARGDTLFAPGAGWIHPRHAEMVAHAKRAYGVRFVLLVHDLIPLRRPEWVGRVNTAMFRNWFASILPLCDA